MEQISNGIYKLTIPTPFLVGPVNTYLIEGDSLTLVDVGPNTVEAWEETKAQLQQVNKKVEDIENIILTHHHPDHIGMIEKFLPFATVYAHRKVKPWITKDKQFLFNALQFYEELYTSHGVPDAFITNMLEKKESYMNFSSIGRVDVEIKEGSRLHFLREWSVIETPGHAQSHISLYRKSDGVLIAGDHLIDHISSNAIIEPTYEGEKKRAEPLLDYRRSLQKCLDMKVAYSGHGAEIDNIDELIKKRINEQDKKAMQFKKMLSDKPKTCFELCMEKYHYIYEKQPDLTFSETLGHLDLLQSRKEIKQNVINGLIYYSQ
ncbi:MBL fold metallo-hydrolase [Evansella cellulosilytica]|uniref:Beta-lactamase domain protein n=1 Tax=Evansella cellulosilytica (strain ATCC 21833 / DSM 2522 / FERM P-1141 / JCM 9156 / N-4) TaxID=649639 RepID=E6U068_EVAC2|nr:MBL fold metallo-hydrolase [Evansella cellulosilytica]ADU29072.1 beta-lactamase domain protein [Evansella cellulosilytica DSM 2522]